MKRLTYIVLLLLSVISVHAKRHVPDSVMHRDGLYVDHVKVYGDSAIFQGANLKLDLFNTTYYLIASQAKLQTYEMALNFRLKNRFYPTLELGYTKGEIGVTGTTWNGQGGWTTVGLDINGMKKNLNSLDAVLIGIRVGTAVQKYDLENVLVKDDYWKEMPIINLNNNWRNEWWGEVVGGCQVNVGSGVMMGWYIRLKLLFTRKTNGVDPYPYYVPGYGYWKYSQWGFNYYIGWKF